MTKFLVSALTFALSASAFAAEPTVTPENDKEKAAAHVEPTKDTALTTKTGVLGGVDNKVAISIGVAAAAGIAAAASGGGGGGGGNGGTTGTTGGTTGTTGTTGTR